MQALLAPSLSSGGEASKLPRTTYFCGDSRLMIQGGGNGSEVCVQQHGNIFRLQFDNLSTPTLLYKVADSMVG